MAKLQIVFVIGRGKQIETRLRPRLLVLPIVQLFHVRVYLRYRTLVTLIVGNHEVGVQ
jgi:hypothetical protein